MICTVAARPFLRSFEAIEGCAVVEQGNAGFSLGAQAAQGLALDFMQRCQRLPSQGIAGLGGEPGL